MLRYKQIHQSRDHFDMAHKASKHLKSGHKFAQIPYRRWYGRGSKGPSGCTRSQPLRSTHCQSDHKMQISSTHRGDDSRFKTIILDRIIKDLQPLNTIKGYQCLARCVHPTLHIQLNDSWIQAELQGLYKQKRMEVRNAVNAVSCVVLSAELWSSNDTMFYLTVSCHLITENWKQKSYLLDTAHLLNDRTPEHVQQQLMRISYEWKITEKIQVVVTNVDRMKNVGMCGCKWIFIPCFARTLDKVFRETICDPECNILLRKCQQIVAFFHQNNKASARLQEHCSNLKIEQTQLTQVTDLKWLPTLHMLKSILYLWPAIFEVFIDFREERDLNENERNILKDVVAALDILKEVTEEMGRYGYRPISDIIPLVQKLKEKLKRQKILGNRIAQKLYEKFDHHTSNIKQHHWFRVSTALDPRYKQCGLFDTGADVQSEIKSQIKGNFDAQAKDLLLEKYWQIRNVSDNSFKFWSTKAEFMQLAPVARKYLTVVSTAIPMERVHRLEQSKIFNRRSSLEPKHLNMILFLNGN